ncbi:MAG: TVP38/TMEM64 family protein [Symploca sp. SIO2E9]|nr:TVP38/TMEM64 family protein [Symploca sp. SIO2E9]
MKRYWTIIGTLLLFFLIVFLIVEQLELPLLTNPDEWMKASTVGTAVLGIALLIADLFIPVPSSLVMIANGALFGVVLGTILSLLGNLGAALTGFFLGKWGSSFISRVVSPEQRRQANRMLEKWGLLAIIVTRPVPLLAETTVIMAGTSTMSWNSISLASLVGSFPGALIYALTGATATSFNNSLLMFGLVLLIAGVFWLVGNLLNRSLSKK